MGSQTSLKFCRWLIHGSSVEERALRLRYQAVVDLNLNRRLFLTKSQFKRSLLWYIVILYSCSNIQKMYKDMYTYISTITSMCIYIYTCAYIYVYIYMYLHICIERDMYMCTLYVYLHIDSHSSLHLWTPFC